jgi:ribosomal protein L37AE/L43A
MELEDIKKCPYCNGVNLERKGKRLICEDCGSKIGLTSKEMWYEFTIEVEEKETKTNKKKLKDNESGGN